MDCLCWIVGAANDINPHSAIPFDPQKIFYTKDMGSTWSSTICTGGLPEDQFHLHFSLAWTIEESGPRVWLVTIASSDANFTTPHVRCYFSDDTGATWKRDDGFKEKVWNLITASPRMYVDQGRLSTAEIEVGKSLGENMTWFWLR